MQKEDVVVTCSPCGEQPLAPEGFNPGVAVATKRGFLNKESSLTTPHHPYGVLPPQVGKLTTHGFTLIELLVVVLIIGILAAVALPQYQKAVAKAQAMESLTLLRSVVPAVREYILANNAFPTSFDDLSVVPSGELGKYRVEHDQVTSGKAIVVMVRGRLDARDMGRGDIPGFIYPTEFSTNYIYLEPNHIYCYHANDGREQPEQICASLGTMVKNNGEDTRFFRID